MNFKRKHENVYQTRKLKVTNIFPRLSSKNDRRGIPFLSFKRIQSKSNKNQAATTCTNLNFIPNQLEENLTTAKVYMESFLLNTTSLKARTQCFLICVLPQYSTTGNTEFHKLDPSIVLSGLIDPQRQASRSYLCPHKLTITSNVCVMGEKLLLNLSANLER